MKTQHTEIRRKDSMEDVGFICEKDPWDTLSDIYGDAFREYRRKWKLASDFELETDYPLQLDFELNNSCNLRCEMCTWSVENPSKVIYFPKEKFEEIITDGVRKGLAALEMSIINEPLLRKDLPGMMAFAKSSGVLDIAFNTNAALLNDELQDEIIPSGLTRIQFSIDANSASTYEKVRRGGDYHKVLKNIEAFLIKKSRGGLKVPMTAVSFVRMKDNERELDDFVKFWKGRVDYLIIREYLSPYGGSSPEAFDKKKLFAESRHSAKDFRCNKPWQRLGIRSDGTALPCCAFHAVNIPVGNVYHQSIEEIWNSEKMRNLRRLHKEGRYFDNRTCLECAACSTAGKR